jgi:hypothetical protein
MRSSRGHLTVLTKRLKRVRTRPELSAYFLTDECGAALAGLNPRDRLAALDAIGRAWKRLDDRAPLPSPTTVTAKWDEQRVLQLQQTVRRCKGNMPDVARELAITEAAARRATYRFIGPVSALAA